MSELSPGVKDLSLSPLAQLEQLNSPILATVFSDTHAAFRIVIYSD